MEDDRLLSKTSSFTWVISLKKEETFHFAVIGRIYVWRIYSQRAPKRF